MFKRIVLAMVLGALASTAFAQTTQSQTSNSNATSTTASTSSNQGVNATVQQISTGQINYSGSYAVKSQVPVSVVGYGSFSQSSCETSVGVGATTRVLSFVYNGPKADINCQHVVLGDAFGRSAQLASQLGAKDMARQILPMVVYTYCTSGLDDGRLLDACIKQHLVIATGTSHKDGKVTVADVVPVTTIPQELADQLLNAKTATKVADVTVSAGPIQTTAALSKQVADEQAAQGPSHMH
ncbi:MAG TPA: hypothetical protein VN081_04500 [Dongiaceae bacterium]|nr:hypothetical protein [Dongiaceae bacterium]